MASPRKRLLAAVASKDLDPLIEIIQDQASRNPTITLAEVVVELDRKQRDGFWSKTNSVLTRAIDSLKTGCDGQEATEVSKRHRDVVNSLTNLIISVIRGKKVPLDEPVLLVLKIHDAFIGLNDEALKNRTSLLCELWWSQKLTRRDEITRNTFLYLLGRATGTKATKSDVKRVYVMRECLNTVNDDALFRRVVTSTLFLGTDEGRKIVALIVTLSDAHVTAFLEDIKIKLSVCGGSVSQRYGEIFLHAWVTTQSDDIREKLEEECIQLFMHHCIHATTKSFAATLQKLLFPFHSRDNPEVQAMLHRLYQPILWRALKATNPVVRCNATTLLFASFPLEDPAANVVDKNEDMQRKLNLMEELLFDPAPDVREVTVLGVSKICGTYWELIPKAVIKTLLTYLVEEFAFDVTSKKVRLAVLKGFTVLLENPLSHPFLKSILHKMGSCLYDPAESVRVRFLDLLLSIKSLRTIKFWDVVEPDDLLDVLSDDTEPVRRRIVQLLINSYHPVSRSDDILVSRCINLLLTHRVAARNFYTLLHHFVDLEHIVHFILLVHRVLHLHVRSKNRKAVAIGEAEDPYFVDPYASPDESGGENDDGAELDNEAIVALLDVVCILWVSVRGQLAQNQNAHLKKELDVKCSKSMSKLFRFFKDSDAFKSVLYLSSLLPASVVPMPVGHCLSRLRSLDGTSAEPSYACFLEAVCRWGRADDIMELITNWLQAGLELGETSATNKKKNKGKSVRFTEVHEPQPHLALRILDSILERPSCRKIVLRHKSNRASLEELLVELEPVQKIVSLALDKKQHDSENPNLFLSQAFQSYCKLKAMLHSDSQTLAQGEEGSATSIPDLIDWVEHSVVSRLLEMEEEETPEVNGEVRRGCTRKRLRKKLDKATVCHSSLAWSVVQSTSTMLVNLLPLPNLDMDLASLIANFFASLLTLGIPNKRREGASILVDAAVCFYRLQECSLTVFRNQGSVILETTLPSLFADAVIVLSKFCDTFLEEAPSLLQSIRSALRDLLSTYKTCPEASHRRALKAIIASIVVRSLSDVASHLSQLPEDADDPDNEEDEFDDISLPIQCSFWVRILAGNRHCLRLFTAELITSLQLGSSNLELNLLSSLGIYLAFSKEKVSGADLKEGIIGIQEIIQLVSREPRSETDTRVNMYMRKANTALQKLKTSSNLV